MNAQVHHAVHTVDVENGQDSNGPVFGILVTLEQESAYLSHAGHQVTVSEHSSLRQPRGAAGILQAGQVIQRQRHRRRWGHSALHQPIESVNPVAKGDVRPVALASGLERKQYVLGKGQIVLYAGYDDALEGELVAQDFDARPE